MKTLILNFKGLDDWDYPVYECNGKLYVDINPNYPTPHFHTKSNNEFDGEAEYPVGEDVEVVFTSPRVVW